jgi:N-methylhydantoinase A
LCKELDISTMVVPQDPGAFCAWGMLTTSISREKSRTEIGLIDSYPHRKMAEHLRMLEKEIITELAREGWRARDEKHKEDISVEFWIEMRYSGQSYEVSVPVSIDGNRIDKEKLILDFGDIHGRLYGHKAEGEPIEVVNFKVKVIWPIPELVLQKKDSSGDKPVAPASAGKRHVFFEGRFIESPIYKRHSLGPGIKLKGPAIVEELTSTTVIHPNQTCTIDPYGNLLVKW